jgi:regulator of sigma E protease
MLPTSRRVPVLGKKSTVVPRIDMKELFVDTLPYFIIVLSIVVFVHEWGHYIVARMCGVKVESFSIGFGPELFGFRDKAGTRWKISLLPLGGYVKMFGDADPTSARPDEKTYEMTAAEKKVAFFYKPVWARAAIVAAGPMVNFLFTFIIFVGLFTIEGQPFTPPRVGEVAKESPAAAAGFRSGDIITKINNKPITRFEEIRREIATIETKTLVEIDRKGRKMELTVTPKIAEVKDRFGVAHKISQIGIRSQTGKLEYRKLDPITAVGASVVEMGSMMNATLTAIGQIIMGTRGTEELGGPLRIAQMSGEVGKEGFVPLVWFMAVISLSLGLFNLFPIPLLDGGHLLFYMIEALKGKPVNESIMDFTSKAGFVFIIGLMVFFTWNDIVQLRIFDAIRGLFS